MSQYSFVGQANTNQTVGASAVSVTYTPTAKNFLVFAVYAHNSETVTMTDNLSTHNTYTALTSTSNASDNYFLYGFYSQSVAGGSTTFTANFNTTTSFSAIYVGEYSGVAAVANPLVGSGQAFVLHPGTGTNAIASSTASPSLFPCLLWGFCGSPAVTNPPIAGTGFAGQSAVWANGAIAEDSLVSVGGATGVNFTASSVDGNSDFAVLMGQFVLQPLMMGQACL